MSSNIWKPVLVLFDLGGVLFDYRGSGTLSEMRGAPFRESELDRFWKESSWAHKVATGRCTPVEFAEGAISELGLEATPDYFISQFRTWLIGYFPGAEDFVEEVSCQVKTCCLSNTNEIDAQRFRHEFSVEAYFDGCYFSNEMGSRKPEPAAFAAVLDDFGVSGDEVLFLDDTKECVDGARSLGIRAEQVAGLAAARRAVRRYLTIRPS